ncbi:hypothetical protein GS19_06700 [Acinetobacter idrijaensis]|nr:hypothetical protein GS19_06700 [Acinetobacter idrijaensis]
MSAPKLRFKEFDEDWSNKKIGNIASKVGSGSTPRGGVEAYTDHGVIFIRSQNVNNDQLLLDDVAYIPEETHLKMSGSKVIANDILLNITGASIGRSCVVPHDFTEANVNQHVCIIRTPNDDPIFVQSFLSSENGQNAIQSKQAGGGREGLNFQAIRSIDFHFPPSKEEQTKIASFLSTVDEKISQLSQKHQLLSQYKQGMMQKLFSQQIRFKADDGSEFGEWEIQSLGNISTHIGGTALESYVDESGTYNFISIGNYSVNGKYIDNSQRIVLNQKTATKLLNKGDLVMVLNDKTASGDLIGSTILINEDNKYIYNQRSERIICNHSNVIPIYLWHFLNAEIMRSEVRKLAQGGTQIYINFGSVLSINFFLPCLEEQAKIANFLSTIDQKIDVASEQLEQAKLWKKGLLQQMFV